eukprot:Rmarinus@m.17589
MADKMETDEPQVDKSLPQDRLLVLARLRFLLKCSDELVSNKQTIRDELFCEIKDNHMQVLYESAAGDIGIPIDKALLTAMKEHNEKEFKAVDEELEKAQEMQTESEVCKLKIRRANIYLRIGDKDKGVEMLKETIEKSMGLSDKLDSVMQIIRVGLAYEDFSLVGEYVDKAKALIEKGGDWERRNRLKVYEGYYLMCARKFKQAAALLIEALPTFTATEMCEFKSLVLYAVLLSMVALNRPDLKKQVVNSSDVLSCIRETPHLEDYLTSLYECRYGDFMQALVCISDLILADPYLSRHHAYYLREVRLVAFSQFLESYQTVTLESMSKSFGVGVDFLDNELSRFIASDRLKAKIDKVAGLVTTTRTDSKNTMYHKVVKQGDALLNRVQKLSRVLV